MIRYSRIRKVLAPYYIESFMNCSPPTTMALTHTQLIDKYDHNRDIAALSDNGLEYENRKAERTAS
jgi:hypothetical protein